MAAALYTDASIKISKRRKLEHDIDQARTEAQALERGNQQRLQSLGMSSHAIAQLSSYITTDGEDKEVNTQSHESQLDKAVSNQSKDGVIDLGRSQPQKMQTGAGRSSWLEDKQYLRRRHDASYSRRTDGDELQYLHNKLRQKRSEVLRVKKQIDARSAGISSQEKLAHQKDGVEKRRALARQTLQTDLVSQLSMLSDEATSEPPIARSEQERWQEEASKVPTRYWTLRAEIVLTTLICRLVSYHAQHFGKSAADAMLSFHSFAGLASLDDIQIRLVESEADLRALSRFKDDPAHAAKIPTKPISSFDLNEQSLEDFRNAQKDLNHRVSNLFQQGLGEDELISNICDTLGKTRVSPNTLTYNILITNLTRLQYDEAANFVWRALGDGAAPYNDVSALAAIELLSAQDRARDVFELAYQMDVKGSRGLLTKNSSTEVLLERQPELLAHSAVPNFRRVKLDGKLSGKAKFWVRMPRDEIIFESLIFAYLETNDLKRACTEFIQMWRSGMQPSSAVLNALLLESLYADDWQSAQVLIGLVFEFSTRGSAHHLRDSVYIMAQAIAQLCPKEPHDYKVTLFGEINRIVLEQDVMTQPFQLSNFKALRVKDFETIKTRFECARRLEKSIIQLSSVASEDVSAGSGEDPMIVPSSQPSNLIEYAALRLMQTHGSFVQRYGSLPQRTMLGRQTYEILTGTIQFMHWREGVRTGQSVESTKAKIDAKLQLLRTPTKPRPEFLFVEQPATAATATSGATQIDNAEHIPFAEDELTLDLGLLSIDENGAAPSLANGVFAFAKSEASAMADANVRTGSGTRDDVVNEAALFDKKSNLRPSPSAKLSLAQSTASHDGNSFAEPARWLREQSSVRAWA